MTDDQTDRKQLVDSIVKGVAIKTLMLAGAASIGAGALAFARGMLPVWSVPAGILFGSVLGLVNFRWLAVAVERLYLRKGATPGLSQGAAVIVSLLKLAVIFIILFVVIRWQLLDVFGLVIGLSVSFLAILLEGLLVMKKTLLSGGQG